MPAALPVVRALFALASSGATGVFRIHHQGVAARGGSVSRLELEQGFVHAMANVGESLRGEETLTALLGRLPEGAEPTFEARAPRAPLLGRPVAAFHPARALRRHVEAARRGAPPPSDQARVELRYRPHASCISVVEAQVVAMLASPRRFAELATAAPRPIAEELVGFLAAAGAAAVDDPAVADAWGVLGLAPGASSDEVKRAWRKLARELHPDLNGAGDDAGPNDERAARFLTVTAAYRRLLQGG